MAPQIVLVPSSGIVGTTVTVVGSGYSNLIINAITFDGLVPVHSAFPTPTLVGGNFTMTFVVPADDRDVQVVTVANATPNTANANFTVLPSLSVTPTLGSIGDAGVTVTGAGYTAGDALTAITVGDAIPDTETVTAQTVAADGSWTGAFTIPQVPLTGNDEIACLTDDDVARATIAIADWTVIEIGAVISDCSDQYGMPVVSVDPVLGIVTFDRSEGAAVKITRTYTCQADPRTMNGLGDNQWDS